MFFCFLKLFLSVIKYYNVKTGALLLPRLTLFWLLLITVVQSGAQHHVPDAIDVDGLKKHLLFLASDELMGRKLGALDGGLEKAADYLADYAGKTGLEPVGRDFFQEVKVLAVNTGENNSIQVYGDLKNPVFKSTDVVFYNRFPEKRQLFNSGEVVFAGFGNNILPDSTLRGKVVIVARGDSASFSSTHSPGWDFRMERAKIERFAQIPVKALIIVTSSNDSEMKTMKRLKAWLSRPRLELVSQESDGQVPVAVATPEFADFLLGGVGKFERYLNEIKPGKSLRRVRKKGTIEIVQDLEIMPVPARNVIGIVEGDDPVLKNEYVVLMAHYDHIGVNPEGDVYNGADDNGSGTVTLMEVAEAFAGLEKKPKRSIVFLWVTGEEAGMLGSKYYTENPVFPIEKTVACINIDMDGRVFEPRDTVWKRSPKMVKDYDGLFTLTNNVWPGLKAVNDSACKVLGLIPDYSLPENFLRSSDHYSFHSKGVPILNYATGYHADYHKVTDETDRINFEKMKRVADLTFLVALQIANAKPEISKEFIQISQ